MKSNEPARSLSSISTLWTVISKAHEGSPKSVHAAQGELIQRYGRAIHRYLLGALRDAEAADELAQEFALRLVRGEFVRANPEVGRFRDFVKGVLSHLIADHYRRRNCSQNLPDGIPEPAVPDKTDDAELVKGWRDELMQQAWNALADVEARTGKPFHTVLRLRSENPDWKSDKLAEQLSARLGMRVTAVWVRQALHRAREKFIELLIRVVLETMSSPTIDELEAELGELGLLKQCTPALKRLRGEQ